MPSSETMTIRVPAETKEKLDRIAVHTRRSKSFLAGEAIAAYVDRELEIIEGVTRALEDAKAGRVVSHEQAVTEMRQLLGKGKQGHDGGE
ncbi:CopG family ribbon-helix-helix protein [Tianweitania sp.]|uniref:CopG family ribbon-helix-helix protein n=1 Tax=Tianweitania sp. TaxID=2021634 RepID=UPI00289D8B20|nr:CopG family ribbon-helix-helix protein [Tianweitania sp.]